jgi:hypothetical protein
VIIGNGAEYGVRGYVTACDAETGRQTWRWFAVPGDPSKPYEDEPMVARSRSRTWLGHMSGTIRSTSDHRGTYSWRILPCLIYHGSPESIGADSPRCSTIRWVLESH